MFPFTWSASQKGSTDTAVYTWFVTLIGWKAIFSLRSALKTSFTFLRYPIIGTDILFVSCINNYVCLAQPLAVSVLITAKKLFLETVQQFSTSELVFSDGISRCHVTELLTRQRLFPLSTSCPHWPLLSISWAAGIAFQILMHVVSFSALIKF